MFATCVNVTGVAVAATIAAADAALDGGIVDIQECEDSSIEFELTKLS